MNQTGSTPPVIQLDPHLRKVLLSIGYMIIVAGIIGAGTLAWPAIRVVLSIAMPFLVGLVLAYIFNPIVAFVQRRLKLTRIGGVLVVLLFLLLAVGTFIGIIVPILVIQTKSAYQGIKDTTSEKVLPWVVQQLTAPRFNPGAERRNGLGARNVDDEDKPTTTTLALPQQVSWEDIQAGFNLWLDERPQVKEIITNAVGSEHLRSAATTAASQGVGFAGKIVSGVVHFITAAISSIVFLVFAGLITFYILVDFGSLRGITEVICPDKYEPRLFDIISKVDEGVGGFIRGQLICALFAGLFAWLGLTLLGMGQYAVLIGCITAVGNVIPYLGPVMGATPAILFMLLTDSNPSMQDKMIDAGLVVALFGFIQFMDGFIFQPKIVGKNAQLHPVMVMLALAVGAQMGIMGMIVAVPMACIVRVLLKEFYWDRREAQWHATTGKLELDDLKPGEERMSTQAIKRLSGLVKRKGAKKKT